MAASSQSTISGSDTVIELNKLLEAANGYASRDGDYVTVPAPSRIELQVFLPIIQYNLGIPVTVDMIEETLKRAGYIPVRSDTRATTWERSN